MRGSASQSDIGGERDPNQVMDNPRLAARSENFEDDEGVKIVKRCYFLAIGDDDMLKFTLRHIELDFKISSDS